MVALVRCVTERGRESMEDSGTMLAHISSLKEMLDQVNEEIEANIEITREIESSIVKCEEIEADLATREADLIKTSALLQFDTVGYVTVAADFKTSVSTLEKELRCLKMKRDEILNDMDEKRGAFTTLCLEFQQEIDKREDCEVRDLLSEKDSLENEIELLDNKNNVLKNSVLAFVEEILEDLHSSNSALQVQLQRSTWENEKLLKDINDLKTTLLSAIGTSDDGQKVPFFKQLTGVSSQLVKFGY
ncbi:hypothetical protein PHAVU_011G012300 [Phaseolus vulgaris]|uniref:Uncharacterized protein n=1 Tax=Phaseolus vulgaris TaxID=3885 RepID=V7AEZ1_PHAVU|nr:hypothetical protein PHAVU_011G012300g [Phaseolus vulgaris]ESW03418.1 hypothetical protein PHAVU_011G012300g [Phaseolus vulgaris]